MSDFMSSEEFRNDGTPVTFRDPISLYQPYGENEYVHILAINHLLGNVDWRSVKFQAMGKSAGHVVPGSQLIGKDDRVLTEPALLSYLRDGSSEEAEDTWGSMIMDLLFMAISGGKFTRLTFIEAKLDSKFTHGSSFTNGQLARYFKYMRYLKSLDHLKSAELNFVLLCPRWNSDWYANHLDNVIKESCVDVSCYMAFWDKDSGIFNAAG